MTCLDIIPAQAETDTRFVLPVSAAQRRLWIQEQLIPGTGAYNISAMLQLSGPLDGVALESSLRGIIARHEVLRTTFGTLEGRPVQIIAPAADFRLAMNDLSDLDEAARGQAVERLTAEHSDKPFDLARGPLVRAQLVRLAGEEHVFLVAMHHIAGDGWSVEIFFRELAALYTEFVGGPRACLPELPFQYADFAGWQQRWLESAGSRRQAEYWRRQLSGAPALLRLPVDFPRAENSAAPAGSHKFVVGIETTKAMERFARGRGATLFMATLSCFNVLLHYLGSGEDIVAGTDIANRSQLYTENLIGFFANQLALRTSLAGDPSYEELLDRARETTLGAYANQELPFDTVVEETGPERSLLYSPLFQAKVVLQNAPRAPFSLPKLAVRIFQPEPRTAKFDLLMNLAESSAGLDGTIYYRQDLFVPATAARIAGLFAAVCELGAENAVSKISAICASLGDIERKLRLEEEANSLAARKSSLLKVRRRGLENTLQRKIL